MKAGPQSPDGRAPSEVTTRGSARGHFTRALYEVVNLAPFVTSFSARLMASWQLYSRRVLWVVMQRNYIGPNLMNQVNVSPAVLTSLACDLSVSPRGSNRGFQHFVQFSHTLAEKKKQNCYYCQSRTCLNGFSKSSVLMNRLISQSEQNNAFQNSTIIKRIIILMFLIFFIYNLCIIYLEYMLYRPDVWMRSIRNNKVVWRRHPYN